ncbi:unnamed protein product [Euphydryas editha]|uniref:Protein slender lobes n=1 Tax=Euphydryas editha TaxID=104508 RepID=A0AAU9VAF9_EUPED|nr:unnamed protein product [Euphydryas editha]
MEEDAGIKAPVTRLRRRISVEQSEESKSPALNTPTKKRGGRRTAKPDLELIDEKTPDNATTKKTTKKAPIKDMIDTIEEKPVTPSRRSTRIKSNTSIVSETALAIDSPRAKRAARRLSQVGSDSEAPTTPVRQTRRTRKDSASSVEKVDAPSSTKPALQITDVIIEEPENNTRKSSGGTNETNISPTNIRKSPRLQGKAKKNNPDNEKENIVQTVPQIQIEQIKNTTHESKDKQSTEVKDSQKNRLSSATSDLIKKLKTEHQVKALSIILNKSTSSIETQLKKKPERKRTKSCTTLTVSNEDYFYSDNEDMKKKLREKNKERISLDQTSKLNSGDGLNTSLVQNIADKSISKKKKKNSNCFVIENIDTSLIDINNKSVDRKNDKNSSVNLNNSQNKKVYETSKLFEKEPSANIHTMVLIEDDSDTNSGKVNIQNRYDHEDQCVPVVHYAKQLEKENSPISMSSEKVSNIVNKPTDGGTVNDSCEPMDVDETIPEGLLISEIKDNDVNTSSPAVLLDKSQSKDQLNVSKRKSSLSQNLNKSENENKSTLILSQLRDTSTDINNVTKSLQNKNTILLKTSDDLNTTLENDVNKRNLSLNYVTTSTPLQQKKMANLVNINTSIIASNNDRKEVVTNECNQSKNENKVSNVVEDDTSKNKLDLNNSVSPNNKSNNEIDKSASKSVHSSTTEDSEEESLNHESKNQKNKSNSFNKTPNQSNTLKNTDSDNESAQLDDESHETSNLFDDEAEDAGDYESGDSLDENERQYLKENEIMETGETLSSENELSNDSDYEKDSFVVSSAEEDNELLEGSEDDLSMSDNELKMTAKSKKKFNERKMKEQKKASREMFESRHKLNKSSEKGNLKKRKQEQQFSSESEDEVEIKTKKHNRMRFDSSQELSLLEDKKKEKLTNKKSNRLSESIGNDNENEITVCNESLKETDPLSANVKEEPKTPQKGDASIAFINTNNDPNLESDLTKTQTQIQDPLKDSMAEDESISSDGENIIQNYDSVLEGLNKTNKTKSKASDISLNIDKKQKKNKNTAIVDELNLTQVKCAKKPKNKNQQKQKENIAENKTTKLDIDDEASSHSIDLHLLFSEDSNSSDNIQNKHNTSSSNKEHFIPLKRTEGKTNIKENMETNIDQSETSFNENYNKKNKKDNSISISPEDTDENGKSFFIDTEGALNNSVNKSISKSKKKKMSLEKHDNMDSDSNEIATEKDENLHVEVADENSDSDAPIDVPIKKEKRISKATDNTVEDQETETDFGIDSCTSITKTPKSEKKKKKKSRDSQILAEKENINEDSSENIKEDSLNVSRSRVKKKKSICETNELIENDSTNQANDKSLLKTPSSNKKNKHNTSSKQQEQEDENNIPFNMSFSETTTSAKKKNLSETSEDNQNESKEESLHLSIFKTPGSQKKKKISEPQEMEQRENVFELSLNNTKVKTPSSQNKLKATDSQELRPIENEEHNISFGSAKKSKKTSLTSFVIETPLLSSTSAGPSESNDTSANKRKRKSRNTQEKTDEDVDTCKEANDSLIGSQKKKRKISQNEDIISKPTLEEQHLKTHNVSKEKKFKKERQNVIINTDVPKLSKNNKRKQRDEDEGHNKVSKVIKQNSFDKVHVPRLPISILKQLDDKPQQIPTPKKPKVISTTEFAVVEAKKRKNKPSYYLEESVYLNDDEAVDKKRKKRLQKPKVLPFVPTALTSASGYTSNFKVNVIPSEIKFVAQSNVISNFKEDYLFHKKIKRQGTYELYKRNRNIKISKF